MRLFRRHLRTQTPDYEPRLFFDVGANIGQTIDEIREHFPETRIFAFEPVPASFRILADKHGSDETITLSNFALGRRDDTQTMVTRGTDKKNAIVKGDVPNVPTSDVAVRTGDGVCAELGVDHIDFLKIDTEGHDIEVLLGFIHMLTNLKIDFVQVEASANLTNKHHRSLEEFMGFLRPMGYDLFRFYEPFFELDGRPLMRRLNAVFVSELIVKEHRRRRA